MSMSSGVSSLLPALASVFDEIDHPLMVADRAGRLLYANREARQVLWAKEQQQRTAASTFVGEMIDVDLEDVLRDLEQGTSSVRVECHCASGNVPARVRWLPKSDWLLIQMYPTGESTGEERQPSVGDESPTGISHWMAAEETDGASSGARGEDEERVVREQVGEGLYFLAASRVMKKIRRQVRQIASVNVPVLISGESGSGKEVVARMIHLHCKSRSGPFVKVNCAALPGELLESELFGYEQGAFTGAVRAKPGKFEMANHGTIFLDEIAEMTTHLQSKLLHILQDGQFSRLGSRHMTQVDVRVVAATNVDVQEAIRQGKFREDLYYRLNVVPCHLPPLRERTEEIPMLFELFLERYRQEFRKNTPEPSTYMMDAAMRYPWPGNVRELENFVKRYVILGDEDESLRELSASAFIPAEIESHSNGNSNGNGHGNGNENGHRSQNLKSLVRGLKDEAEAKAIAEALRQTNWRRKDAARILGISYKALLYKMRQFGFTPASSDVPHTELM
jgi:transcriptional regulator with PAS, ATPase and Fis domain